MMFKIEVLQEDRLEPDRIFFCPGVEVMVKPIGEEEEARYRKMGWVRNEWWHPAGLELRPDPSLANESVSNSA